MSDEADQEVKNNAPEIGANTSLQDDKNFRRARDLARILKVNVNSFSDNPGAAYDIMSHVASIPLIKEHEKRRQLANESLQNARKSFPKSDNEFMSPFHGQIASLVIEMQEFPYWFSIISDSNADLINEYKNLLWIVWGLSIVGYSGYSLGAGAIVTGAVGAVDKLPTGSGARDMLREAGKGVVNSVKKIGTSGFVGRSFVLAWVVGQTSASLAKARKAEVEFELNRRYKENKLSYDEYQEAFGVNVDPPQKYIYGL